MRSLALLLPLTLAASAPPHRVVSLNLCADQLVLALADRGQIAGVSKFAADPALSAMAVRARELPVIRDSTEQLTAHAPDLAIGVPVPFSFAPHGAYRVLDLPDADTYAGIRANIARVAQALGQRARGAALIARMDAALARVPRQGRGQVVAYYQRRGYLTGTGTLIDELMRRVGLVNLAGRLGKPPLSQLSLEEVVAARPDFLIMESGTADVRDQGTEMLHHPALRGIKVLWLPEAWTACGSPAYVPAARSLAAQLARYDARRGGQ